MHAPRVHKFPEGFHQIAKALDGVIDAGCSEGDDIRFADIEGRAGIVAVHYLKSRHRDGIGYHRDGQITNQSTLPGPLSQPVAHSHERQSPTLPDGLQHTLFLAKHLVSHILHARFFQERTVVTLRFIVTTFVGMMADSRCLPHVVHGPYDGLAALENLFYAT